MGFVTFWGRAGRCRRAPPRGRSRDTAEWSQRRRGASRAVCGRHQRRGAGTAGNELGQKAARRTFPQRLSCNDSDDTSGRRLHGASDTAAPRGGGSIGVWPNPMATVVKEPLRELHRYLSQITERDDVRADRLYRWVPRKLPEGSISPFSAAMRALFDWSCSTIQKMQSRPGPSILTQHVTAPATSGTFGWRDSLPVNSMGTVWTGPMSPAKAIASM